MGLFLRYLPFVIEQGKLYVANPPLYGVQIGKQTKFFADNLEYTEYVQQSFTKDNKVAHISGKEITKKELTKILYNNADYMRLINHVSGTYAIDPYLLEFLLVNKDLDFNKFKKAVQKQYRYLTIEDNNGTIVIRGLVGSAYQTIFFGQRLLNDCTEILDLIHKSEDHYVINGQVYSLYGLMNLYHSFEPKNITRFKGLGRVLPVSI